MSGFGMTSVMDALQYFGTEMQVTVPEYTIFWSIFVCLLIITIHGQAQIDHVTRRMAKQDFQHKNEIAAITTTLKTQLSNNTRSQKKKSLLAHIQHEQLARRHEVLASCVRQFLEKTGTSISQIEKDLKSSINFMKYRDGIVTGLHNDLANAHEELRQQTVTIAANVECGAWNHRKLISEQTEINGYLMNKGKTEKDWAFKTQQYLSENSHELDTHQRKILEMIATITLRLDAEIQERHESAAEAADAVQKGLKSVHDKAYRSFVNVKEEFLDLADKIEQVHFTVQTGFIRNAPPPPYSPAGEEPEDISFEGENNARSFERDENNASGEEQHPSTVLEDAHSDDEERDVNEDNRLERQMSLMLNGEDEEEEYDEEEDFYPIGSREPVQSHSQYEETSSLGLTF